MFTWRDPRPCITVASMTTHSPGEAGAPKRKHFDPPYTSIKARQMGELNRGDDRWDVMLESVRDEEMNCVRGRIHFVCGDVHRLTGWVFLEWAEKDIEIRFNEFSAQELWNLLDSLA